MSEVSGQIEEIIDAAERAAVEIQAEAKREAEEIRIQARREAGAYVDERRRDADDVSGERARALEAIRQPLLERVERLRAEVAAAADELDRAHTAIAELGPSPTPEEEEAARPAPSEPLVRLAGGVPSDRPNPAYGAPEEPTSTHEEAVLRATQLAVLGKAKADIEATLRREFELADPAAVVDSILGPE